GPGAVRPGLPPGPGMPGWASEWLVGYAPAGDTGWTVVVEQPVAQALAPARTLREVTGITLLAVIVLATVAGVLAARRLTAPLTALTRAVDAFARGGRVLALPRSGIAEVAQ